MQHSGQRSADIVESFRQSRVGEPVLEAIDAYLRDKVSLGEVQRRAGNIQRNTLYPQYPLSQPEGKTLDDLDLLLLDVAYALNQPGSFLRLIANNGDVATAAQRLIKDGMSERDLIRTLDEPMMAFFWLDFDGKVTALGRELLRYVPTYSADIIDDTKAYSNGLFGFVRLLLAASPPQIDLAFEAARLEPLSMGRTAGLLLNADQQRFTPFARMVAGPGSPADLFERARALEALLQLQPEQNLDLALAAAQTPIDPDNRPAALQEAGIDALFASDPEKYRPLAGQLLLTPEGLLGTHIVQLLAEKDFKSAIPSLERAITDGSVWTAQAALEYLVREEWPGRAEFFIGQLGHKSKQIRDALIEELVKLGPGVVGDVATVLDTGNAAGREAAALILGRTGGDAAKAALRSHLDGEKSAKVRAVMIDAAGMPAQATTPSRTKPGDPEAALIKTAENLLRRVKRPQLSIDNLPDLKWRSGETAPPEIVDYLLYVQSRVTTSSAADEILQARELFDPASAGDWALALFNGWYAAGAPAKEVWAVALAGTLGDDRLIMPLYRAVDDLSKGTRGAVAAKAVRALGILGSDLALVQLNDIAARFKHKGVRDAAREAFAATAEHLKVSEDELADRIVPTFGFDKKGELALDYGERKFVARLGLDLGLTLRDEQGKKIAALPKPNRNDDADKAAAAQEQWKQLKVQVKTACRLQTQRLERAMIGARSWTSARWRELFLQHPLLRPFAIGIVWGVAPEDGAAYTQLFRPLEDGSLTDAADEAVKLPGAGRIRMVHPVELDDETLKAWTQHLADYEVKQPFVQLARPVFRVPPAIAKERRWTECKGYVVPALLFKGRYLTAGWERGSVQDAGVYHNIWKAYPGQNVEAVLEIWGVPVAWSGDWNTALLELAFVPSASIRRGSYLYDDLTDDDGRPIPLGQVPTIVFSEATADVALLAATGEKYDDWEKRVG